MMDLKHTIVGLTEFHSKYLAHALTRRCPSDSVDKLAGAVAGAQVDLNPHQVDAALFAFRSPLSKGALLADEVGLGKTIEAGLVISQRWAERKRRILVITPANLRKQWHQELNEKFFLPCQILETKGYNAAVRQGRLQPFDSDSVVICSYQFARAKATDVASTGWDLVVIDEAHRLRNVYKPTNIIANTLKTALANKHKLLLTATPLQNSLLELFGLASFIDEHTFGDIKSFREQFLNLSQEQVFRALQERLKPICHRTLRRQVTSYIPFTKRLPIVEEFTPEESEDRLYDLVSDYLRRDNLQALPSSQRSLMTLVLRKLLASSSFAIAGALESISNRLKAKLEKRPEPIDLEDDLAADYETLPETAEEWPNEENSPALSDAQRSAIEIEIADLDAFAKLALSITQNAKGVALLKALGVAFAKAKQLGAAEKAIIFTESRKTQDYLLRVLADSAFKDGIVLFNGSNNDERSKQLYAAWLEKHSGTDRVTGSKSADMRSALVDYFREEGRIMIATEAGAEGINLQFCSLVVNYDLPWNPQRIEQRIGRAHRYGQKHDVVVVNFLNRKNEADRRVFQLLSEKFQLFEGVFGASDEVLGALESGVDLEKRIADIYQRCRRTDEIKVAFDQLQLELSLEINETVTQARRKLLENFDDEVREKLKIRATDSAASLNRMERWLMRLTEYELGSEAQFTSDSSFRLTSCPFPDQAASIPLGVYELPRRSGDAYLYRLGHPLAEAILQRSKARTLPVREIRFDYGRHEGIISILEPLVGRAGWISLSLLTVEALGQVEEHLVFSAFDDTGTGLDAEQAARLFSLPASTHDLESSTGTDSQLDSIREASERDLLKTISERNGKFFEAEVAKLDGWADDQVAASEKALKDVKRRLRELRNEAEKASGLNEKARIQSEISETERRQRKLRQDIFEVEDRILAERDRLVAAIRGKLNPAVTSQPLFIARWSMIDPNRASPGS
jgi:superfamily II DNA or RNA helicase